MKLIHISVGSIKIAVCWHSFVEEQFLICKKGYVKLDFYNALSFCC